MRGWRVLIGRNRLRKALWNAGPAAMRELSWLSNDASCLTKPAYGILFKIVFKSSRFEGVYEMQICLGVSFLEFDSLICV